MMPISPTDHHARLVASRDWYVAEAARLQALITRSEAERQLAQREADRIHREIIGGGEAR